MACSREYSYPTGTPSQRTKDAGDAQRWHRGRLALSACPEKSGQKSGIDGTTCWPKVADGGWKRYEQAHRKQLVSMFVPKLRLPADVLSLVVDFWAHIGYY